MKLEEILPYLREGKKIRKKDWDKDNYMGRMSYRMKEEVDKFYEFDFFDFDSEDWELYIEPEEQKISNDEYLRELDIYRLLHKETISQLENRILTLEKAEKDLQERLKVLTSPIISIE